MAQIELAEKAIERRQSAVNCNVSIKSIPAYSVFSLRRIVADYYAEGELWQEMSAYANEHKIAVSQNTLTIFHDTEYKEKDVDIEVCAPVSQPGKSADGFTFRTTQAVPLMACTMVYGPFENISSAYFSLAEWLQEHNRYKMCGQNRQIVHRGPWNEEDPDNYLTEIQLSLKKI